MTQAGLSTAPRSKHSARKMHTSPTSFSGVSTDTRTSSMPLPAEAMPRAPRPPARRGRRRRAGPESGEPEPWRAAAQPPPREDSLPGAPRLLPRREGGSAGRPAERGSSAAAATPIPPRTFAAGPAPPSARARSALARPARSAPARPSPGCGRRCRAGRGRGPRRAASGSGSWHPEREARTHPAPPLPGWRGADPPSLPPMRGAHRAGPHPACPARAELSASPQPPPRRRGAIPRSYRDPAPPVRARSGVASLPAPTPLPSRGFPFLSELGWVLF